MCKDLEIVVNKLQQGYLMPVQNSSQSVHTSKTTTHNLICSSFLLILWHRAKYLLQEISFHLLLYRSHRDGGQYLIHALPLQDCGLEKHEVLVNGGMKGIAAAVSRRQAMAKRAYRSSPSRRSPKQYSKYHSYFILACRSLQCLT
jgi:hypothetical protein